MLPNYWAIMPPYHNYKKHADMGGDEPLKRTPNFVYTSVEMAALEKHLSALYGELSEYREKLRVFIARHKIQRL
jgi:hypothetical protein